MTNIQAVQARLVPHMSDGLEVAHGIWRRRKWLALAVWIWTLGAAGTASVALPNMYSATATLLIERQQVPEALVRPAVTGALETRLQTITQGILSRSRLEDLILRFELYPGLREQGSVEAAVEQMRRDIHVEAIGAGAPGQDATVAFTVSYDGWDPLQVAEIAGVLASFYVEENLRMREAQATGTTAFLKAELERMKAQLDERAARLNEFRRRHAWELSDQLRANLTTLERLNAQLLLNAETQKRALERRDSPTPPSSPRASDQAAVRLAELRRDLAALRARVTDAHPDLIRLRGEIAALEEQARAATDDSRSDPRDGGAPSRGPSPPTEADAELATLKGQEQSLRKAIAEYERRIESTARREPEFQKLSRDYEAASDAYYSLRKRYDDARLAESLEHGHRGEYVRTLDPPLPPEQPVAPNRLRLLLMSLVLSLGAAAAAAVVAERLDTSFHTADELRAFTRAPIAASIARIVISTDGPRRRRRLAAGVLGVACVLALTVVAAWVFAHGHEHVVRLLARRG